MSIKEEKKLERKEVGSSDRKVTSGGTKPNSTGKRVGAIGTRYCVGLKPLDKKNM